MVFFRWDERQIARDRDSSISIAHNINGRGLGFRGNSPGFFFIPDFGLRDARARAQPPLAASQAQGTLSQRTRLRRQRRLSLMLGLRFAHTPAAHPKQSPHSQVTHRVETRAYSNAVLHSKRVLEKEAMIGGRLRKYNEGDGRGLTSDVRLQTKIVLKSPKRKHCTNYRRDRVRWQSRKKGMGCVGR